MLNRNVTRVIKNTTEVTDSLQNVVDNPTPWVLTTPDFVYIGFRGKFASRHFQIGTANAASSVVSIEYWNGTAWTSVLDIVDQTNGFKIDGWISWVNQNDWQKKKQTPIDDVDLFYVRLSVSVDLDGGTTLQSLVNLFSDDDLISVYYPELISDNRYLPPNRTNFMEQHVAAREKVILRLMQRRTINDEAQIIDINEVAVAAVHAAVETLLRPITQGREIFKRAQEDFKNEINELTKAIDKNKDGIVSNKERNNFSTMDVVRRG